ncbi:hypothetical protein Agau_P200298 (plasmid) [Agrobacterium tumefaciens F2]|nr:hypothetical protein Agau_P200298 [Agrobacterium tumefaciens F2]
MTAEEYWLDAETLFDNYSDVPKRQISDEDLASLAEEIEANLLESL